MLISMNATYEVISDCYIAGECTVITRIITCIITTRLAEDLFLLGFSDHFWSLENKSSNYSMKKDYFSLLLEIIGLGYD